MNNCPSSFLKPHLLRGCKPPYPNTAFFPGPYSQPSPENQSGKSNYWRLLSPALLGAAGAFFLSFFSEYSRLPQRSGGAFFKLALVGYAFGTTIAANFAVTTILTDSEPPHENLVQPVSIVLFSIILFYAAEYLLLYRFFPASFSGDIIGESFLDQTLSFLYFSITTISTGNLGDIMPEDITARALISSEMLFYLYTMATVIQLILTRF